MCVHSYPPSRSHRTSFSPATPSPPQKPTLSRVERGRGGAPGRWIICRRNPTRLSRLAHVQESFLNSVVRVLFKTDPPGFFERSYPRLLEMNTWQSINQEILCVPSLPVCLLPCWATRAPPLSPLKTPPPLPFPLSNSWCVFWRHRISTPRRFGKTIAVCLFVAALIYACPNIEISIYSTCNFRVAFRVIYDI